MAQPTQLTPTEQDALVKQIGLAMLRVAPDDWEQLTVDYRAVGRYAESTSQVTYSDGGVDSWEMPADLRSLFARLRAGMYREGRGTWFNARYKLDHPSSYNLEYDREEPGWDMPPPPQAYPDDMRLFPRSDENVPEWLRRRLATAPPPPGPPPGGPDRPLGPPRFRVARIFDGPGEDGRPSVNRPEVDELDISQLLDYLDSGPLVGPARGYDVDRLDPNGQQSVPVAFHTDGTWIWPAAVNYYLREHDISPEPDLVEHVRRMRFKVPQVDEQTRSAAQAFLGPPPGPPGPRPGPPVPGGPPAPAPTRAMPVPAPPVPAPAPPPPAPMAPPRAALPSQGPPAQQIDQLRARLDDLDVPETAYRIGPPTGRGWVMEQTDEGWRVGWHDREWVAPAMFEDVADASAFLLGKLMLDTDRWAAGPKNPELPPSPPPVPSSLPSSLPPEDRGFEPMSAPIEAFEPLSAPIEDFAPAGEPTPARRRQVGPPPGTPGYATPPPGTPGYGDTPARFTEPASGSVYSDPAGGSGFTDDAGFADSPGFAKPSGRFTEPPGSSDYSDSPGGSDYAKPSGRHTEQSGSPDYSDTPAGSDYTKPSGRYTEPSGTPDYAADSPGDFAEPSGGSDYAEPRGRFTEPSGNSDFADSPGRSAFSGSPGYGESSGSSGFSEPSGDSDSLGRAGRPDYAEPSGRSSFSEPSGEPDYSDAPGRSGRPPGTPDYLPPGRSSFSEPADSSDSSGRSSFSEPASESDYSDAPAFSGVPGFSEPSPKYVPRSSFSEPSDKSDYSSESGFSEPGAPGYSEPSDGFTPPRQGPPPGTPPRPQPTPTMAMEPASPPRGIEMPARGEQATVLASRPNGAAAAPAGSEWPITPLPGEPPLTLFRGKRVIELEPGMEIDRFGDDDGNLVYVAGTPFAERSLVPEWIDRPYHAYRVRQPVQVLTGAAIPWFDQPGGGTAYLLPDAIGELVALGQLVELDGRDRPA